jgi:tetratricopeptide (TPR) repeat protein
LPTALAAPTGTMRRTLLAALAAAALSTHAAGRAAAQPDDDWAVQRDPFDKTTIARYKAILAKNPHDAGALNKLLDLYRRYRTADLLHDEYTKALDKKPGDFAILVVLARLDRAGGDEAAALARFEAAAKAKPDDATVSIELGTIYRNSGKLAEARKALDAALAAASAKPVKIKALGALADLALATNDIEGFKKYSEQYIALDPKNVQLRLDLGDALRGAQKYDEAVTAYRDAEKMLGSDPGKKMEVIARIGDTLKVKGDGMAAVAEYRRAIKIAPRGYYLENELTQRVIEVYGDLGKLPELLAQYEKEWAVARRGFFEWDQLARLYDQLGRQSEAIAAYKKAVGKAPLELDTQTQLIKLLERAGRSDDALAQLEEVARIAPGEARFQHDLAQAYWKRGDAKKALDTLKRLEARFPAEPGVLAGIADLYIRWQKEDLAIALYERLARLEPDEPNHLVALGDQYFQRQEKTKAIEIWKRIANAKTAAAEAKLGDVLNEHGMPAEALQHYAKALKMEPNNPELYKGEAVIREGQRQYQEALDDWEKALKLYPEADKGRRREVQRRIVQVLVRQQSREHEYRQKWIAAFKKEPPDLEAGYFLVEYYTKKPGTADEPRLTLERLHTLDGKNQDTITELVKAYRNARMYDQAVAMLMKLKDLEPKRKFEAYVQASAIMTEARRDKEADEYMQLAKQERPEDPSTYENIAERRREQHDFPEAIKAYEKVIALDETNWKAYFAVARLYVHVQEPLKAVEKYRSVLHDAQDDDTIERAAKEAINLEELTGTLGELEKKLSPLAFLTSQKPIYRRKLVDLYLRYVPQLVEREAHGDPAIRAAARRELDRLGTNGLKPLLEALHDEKDLGQQRIAVQVLGHLGNRGAAAPLIQLAKQEPKPDPAGPRKIGTLNPSAEMQVRVDAMISAGRLGDPAVIEAVLPLAKHEEVALREAAVFTLGRTGDKRAVAPLVAALADTKESVQAIACLGLAAIDDAKAVAALTTVVGETRRHDLVRAACAYGLGLRRTKAAHAVLAAALIDNHGETQRLAGWALGQIGDDGSTGPLLRAYFSRRDGERAELAWAIARTTGAQPSPTVLTNPGDYPVRGGAQLATGNNASTPKLDLVAKIHDLPGAVPAVTLGAATITAHVDAIVAGITDALGEHRDIVLGALTDLDARPEGVGLAGLVGDGPIDEKTRVALAKVGAGVAAAVAAHLRDDDAKVREVAIRLVAKLDAKGADDAIIKALGDKTGLVRRAAMRAAVVHAGKRAGAAQALAPAIGKALASGEAWQDRQAAALALADLGGLELPALIKAAKDPTSYVREAVATALGASAAAGASDALIALSKDEIAPVRAAAARALGKVPGEAARARRAALAADKAEDPAVQAAAKQ